MAKDKMVPQLRFKGFADEWEQRMLCDCCSQLSATLNPQDTPDDVFTEYSMPAFDNGEIPNVVAGFTMNSVRKILDRPCLLINKLNVRKKRIWNVEKPEKSAVSSAEFVPVFSDEINLNFLKYIVLSDSFTAYLEDCSSGSSNSQKRVTPEVIMSATFLTPSKGEQDRIGEFLIKLDNLITIHQHKYDKLLTLKKSMLEKMFPKVGSDVPEIRFVGFTGAWEQRKLGALVQFSKGSGYSKSDLKEFGTPIILYGRLYTNYETVIADVDTFAEPKPGSVFSRGGEIIVPASGETAEDISIASVVEKSGVLLGGDLNIISPPTNLDSAFLAISISNGKPHDDMARMAQGKSVVHLHNTDLEKIDLAYPSYEEQTQISTYFKHLDTLITLHRQKHEKLKQIKQSMLEKMFV